MGGETHQADRTIATVAVAKLFRRAIGPSSLFVAVLALRGVPLLVEHLTRDLLGPPSPHKKAIEGIESALLACFVVLLFLGLLGTVVLPLFRRTLDIVAGVLVAWPVRLIGRTIPLHTIAEVHIRVCSTVSSLGTDRGVALVLDLPESSGPLGWCCNCMLRLKFLTSKYHVLIPAVFLESPEQIAATIAGAAREARGKVVPITIIEKSGRRRPYCDSAAGAVATNLDGSAAPPVSEGVSCVECGYDLRKQPSSGVCPECGSSIRESMQGHLLQFAQPHWVRSLRRGAFILTIAGVAFLLTTLTFLPLTFTLRRGGPPPIVLGLTALLSGALSPILLSVGVLFLTRREPRRSDSAAEPASRRMARCGLGLLVLWVIWLIAVITHLLGGKFITASFVWVNVVVATLLLWYSRHIFARAAYYRMRTVATVVAAVFTVPAAALPLLIPLASFHAPSPADVVVSAAGAAGTSSSILPLKSQAFVLMAALTISFAALPAAFTATVAGLWIALRGIRAPA